MIIQQQQSMSYDFLYFSTFEHETLKFQNCVLKVLNLWGCHKFFAKEPKIKPKFDEIKLLQKEYQMNIKWYEFPAGEK